MYDRLCSMMSDAGNISPSYRHMAISLNNGESMHSLASANELKIKLIRLQEQIDMLSDKIRKLGLADEHSRSKPSPRDELLQRNIRQLAVTFMQELLSNMPSLPTAEEYDRLRAEHRERVQQRIDDDRAEAAALRPSLSQSSFLFDEKSSHLRRSNDDLRTSASFTGLKTLAGWTPDPANLPSIFHYNPFVDDDEPIDPLQQQVLIIKGYLKQAAEAGRLEEVQILERNLKDLEDELKQQHVGTPRDQ